jgi:hypothetical protein
VSRCARKNDTRMRTLAGIMSQKSKIEYLENCRARYPSRNRVGRSAMIDGVGDTLGWDRKHAIKALNGQVSLGRGARKRGSKARHKIPQCGPWEADRPGYGKQSQQDLRQPANAL